jgi:hypothetical protein
MFSASTCGYPFPLERAEITVPDPFEPAPGTVWESRVELSMDPPRTRFVPVDDAVTVGETTVFVVGAGFGDEIKCESSSHGGEPRDAEHWELTCKWSERCTATCTYRFTVSEEGARLGLAEVGIYGLGFGSISLTASEAVQVLP